MLSSLKAAFPPAILALADGTVFIGNSIGSVGTTVGEVVFNTAMTGYQEILTDPSYCQQIVTLTYPHIGNYGVNEEDMESSKVQAAGLVIRDLPLIASNFRAQQNLSQFLNAQGAVAIANIDTRKLTRLLREKGTQNGAIVGLAASEAVTPERIAAAIAGIDTRRLTRILRERGAQNGALLAGAPGEALDVDKALEAARKFPGLKGMDLAKVVSTAERYPWTAGELDLDRNEFIRAEPKFRVVAYDFGVKRNILRMLAERSCEVTVVPAQTPAAEVRALGPDGVFLSNGPGDPEPCDYAIAAIREFIARKIPTFGICLGHQLLGLAAGARTMKMAQGHHGANHPVQDLTGPEGRRGKVMITSQNHGFCIDEASLPANVRVTHRSLFDGTNQGIALTDAPAFGFQGHPEASPGPHDVSPLFDRFVALMEAR